MPKKPSKPHDEFFKATFGRVEIALDYLRSMLPIELLDELDLTQLERINGSFVEPSLQESFSDVVYQCPFKNQYQEVNLSFILEHKSQPEPRPHLQLLRYMLAAWTEQLNQKKGKLTPIIPILVYQGKQNWKKQQMSSYFGKGFPSSLLPYLPQFDYIFTHVTAMSDEQIMELRKGLLINTFLMMKHIWDPEYILQNPKLIFINLEAPTSPQDFIVLILAYFYKNSELGEDKIRDFIKSLPETINDNAMSTYDMIVEKGIQIGREMAEDILSKERQRAEEEHNRAEEERQRTEKAILYLHQTYKKEPFEIAAILGTEVTYVETVLTKAEKEDIIIKE
jgi:predicted transposase/invertase (TIGR01784 family)